MAGTVVPAFVSAGGNASSALGDISARMDMLEFQAGTISQSLRAISAFSGSQPVPPLNIGEQAPLRVAQSRDVASLNVRLGQLEEQMRVLVGQVEGLQFQMTQFQTLIERLQEDTDFRFKQLEGGGSGKTEAAAQSGGDRPVGELPQDQETGSHLPLDLSGSGVLVSSGQASGDAARAETGLPDGSATEGDGPDFAGEEGIVLGGDGIGTFDPASDGGDVLGGGDVPGLDFDPGALVSQGDADAQYSAGYDAIVRGDYEFAESQFRQFISLFPDDLHAPDAANWLGESLLQQHRYDEAAQVLFDGFENYPKSLRAPDLLLKLAIALDGAGEKEVACRTFGEVLRRFPSVQPAFRQRLASEMARAKC